MGAELDIQLSLPFGPCVCGECTHRPLSSPIPKPAPLLPYPAPAPTISDTTALPLHPAPEQQDTPRLSHRFTMPFLELESNLAASCFSEDLLERLARAAAAILDKPQEAGGAFARVPFPPPRPAQLPLIPGRLAALSGYRGGETAGAADGGCLHCTDPPRGRGGWAAG